MSAAMQKQWGIYYGRLERFISEDYMREMNIVGQLVKQSWKNDLKIEVWSPGDRRVTFCEAREAEYKETTLEKEFGPSWTTHWFRITVQGDLDGAWFHWKSQAESMVWTADGRPVHGLSAENLAAQERDDFEMRLVTDAKKGPVVFYIEMACNWMFGNSDGHSIKPPSENRYYKVTECDLRHFNPEALNLYYDLQILHGMAQTFGEQDPRGKRALFVANNIINQFNRPDLGSVGESIKTCQEISNEFLRPKNAHTTPMVVTAVGNCHIDTAWLWRYEETRRKTARSFSSQLALMEKHPKFIFAASQMQQFEWLRQDYPDLFSRIQDHVKEGRFLPVGGSWVEMDGNLPCGESFVRQFLYGQKFMMEHFGGPSEIFWLPDTFGYNAQLPQLMSKAGMKYFVTQKLSWNNINKFPHSSFIWEGIDGSSVLAHFPPANTYTSAATSGDIIRSEEDHKDVDRSSNAMLLYGHGDGGGGPTEAMLSRLERMSGIPGMPEVRFDTPLSFFKRLQKESHNLLRWRGELYFELHRGTYSSQARTKFYNRRCERLLREAEMLSVINGVVSNNLKKLYPSDQLEALWKDVLLNQFHDVLPGSSIGSVYKDSEKLYRNAEFNSSKIRDDAMNNLFGNKVGSAAQTVVKDTEPLLTIGERVGEVTVDPASEGLGVVFFNTTPYTRDEVITVPWDGNESSPQHGVLAVAGVNGFSMASFAQSHIPMSMETVQIMRNKEHYIMENKFVRVHINETGHITSFFDKENDREVISSGAFGNRFMMYEDVPHYWDAWDVELHHLEKGWCVSQSSDVQLSIEMKGPLLVSLLRIIKVSPDTVITQVISLSCLSKRLDFTCRVEWHESHRILKVDFPLAIHSDFATFECPFGTVTRPTHFNTSWDVARFEVCGHCFADLSEPNYGVALLNDCKYGYSVRDSLMQLSLLRSPKMPDDDCDMGSHVMRFALFPHNGNVSNGGVIEEAAKFNTPLLWTAASPSLYDDRWLNSSVLQFKWCRPSKECYAFVPLAIEAIKLAEDDSGDVIIRAYEPRGCRGIAALHSHQLVKISSLRRCDLLERDESLALEKVSGLWTVKFTPYEIVSLRARLELGPDAHPIPHKQDSPISSFESI